MYTTVSVKKFVTFSTVWITSSHHGAESSAEQCSRAHLGIDGILEGVYLVIQTCSVLGYSNLIHYLFQESGINAMSIRRRAAQEQGQEQQQNAEAGPSGAQEQDEENAEDEVANEAAQDEVSTIVGCPRF